MDILHKHKKKGLQGFKDFVYYLELADSRRIADVMSIAWLEDPVYTQYLIPNLANFEYFISKLESDEYEKIFKNLANGALVFTLALKNTPEREKLFDKLPVLVGRKLVESEEITLEVAPFQKIEARNTIIKKMRELQDHREITPFHWKIPSETILKGEHIVIPSNGKYLLKYENGHPALEGGYEKKLRTGDWKHFHPNGKIFATGHYTQGEKIGSWCFYDYLGNKTAEGQYREDLRAGEWNVYNSKGDMKTVCYERGRLI